MKKMDEQTEFTLVCHCDPQTFYECGGMGCTRCELSVYWEKEKVPANASKGVSGIPYIPGSW